MLFRILFFVLWVGTLGAQTLPPEARFVMSHFKSDGGGGDERLYISWSADGLNWTGLNSGNPVWQPPDWAGFYNVVRDPAIVFADGFYWVCYTQGYYGRGLRFGLVRSADLLNWTQVGPIDVPIAEATDPFTWSPSFFVDGDGSVHVFVSICPVTPWNPVPSMRIYETHPLNAGWTQWSPPVAVELPDTNTNEFFGWKEGNVYHCLYIDFSRNGAVVHATSPNLLTGWVRDRVLGYNSQEGPFVLPKPDGGYRLYLEPGNGPGGVPPTHYRWCDFDSSFSSATAQVAVNSTIPMRNGKPCAARGALSFANWQAQQLSSVPVPQRAALADADGDGMQNLVEHALGTNPTLFTGALRRPQPYFRSLPSGWHSGLVFDWFPSSSDVSVRAEVRLADDSWSSAPSEVVVESQTLLSDGTMRTLARAAEPLGLASMWRISATQAASTVPLARMSTSKKIERKRATPPPVRKRPRR